MLQKAEETLININCADPLGRSALLMAIDNENLEMVELLLEYRVETKDALLHAIAEEYVEAVEVRIGVVELKGRWEWREFFKDKTNLFFQVHLLSMDQILLCDGRNITEKVTQPLFLIFCRSCSGMRTPFTNLENLMYVWELTILNVFLLPFYSFIHWIVS